MRPHRDVRGVSPLERRRRRNVQIVEYDESCLVPVGLSNRSPDYARYVGIRERTLDAA